MDDKLPSPLRAVLRQKLVDSWQQPLPRLTLRDTWIPRIPAKTLAVIGMRRSGKTSLLWQEVAQRVEAGGQRSWLPVVSLEDERLLATCPDVELLDQLLETYFQLQPQVRQPGQRRGCLFLDEIQRIPGWEGFVRRVMDSEPIDVVVSGSSAAMLSSEIASNLRGRAVEAVVYPFSFRESLRHLGLEPQQPPLLWSSAERSRLSHQLERYLRVGGFPEVQGLEQRSRRLLLSSYVDSTVLRDVIERHAIRQPLALQWLVRQLLGNGGGGFSLNRLHGALRSQGLAISREHLAELVQHLESAFLIQCIGAVGGSLRRQMTLPRKVYPIDPGLLPLYELEGRSNLGHALETVVLLELRRRGAEVGYLRTSGGFEVDFHARFPDGHRELIQVCADLGDAATRERECRALHEALQEPLGIGTQARVITLDRRPQHAGDWPDHVVWSSALEWLLDCQ
ncbi:MAG: ATP-binding protein [Cyanobacteria bacterium K_Offshore_0m_m2_072]|nr:ATP-binding protein [Cyanobacteria bacterium K_Offshore_0m_m2_072]